MRLILIRHGLTDYNLKKSYCGFKDVSLNRIGKAQLNKVKNKLKRFDVDKVICSDLKRSWQSAKIIFRKSIFPIIKNPNLREINFGKWEGLSSKQILKKYSSIYRNWIKDPWSINIPRGERIDNFISRIEKELKRIINENKDKNIALVTHSGPIRVILNSVFKITKRDFWQLKINPQRLYIIEYNGNQEPKVFEL